MIANRSIHDNVKRGNNTKSSEPTLLERANGVIMDICTRYRGILLTLFVLPISLAVNVLWFLRMSWALHMGNPANHTKKVRAVSDAVRHARATGKKMCTARPGWQAMSLKTSDYKAQHALIPTHTLVDILGLREDKDGSMVVVCEPLVSMGQLSRYLVARGYTLPVVPELDELTVGGLLMGFGIESSSHKYGLIQENCVAYELVLGDGRVIEVTADNEHKDLFYALPWSHGTIGMLVSATLKIRKCAKFVRLEHRRIRGIDQVTDRFIKASKEANPADFVECLLYKEGHGVLMQGNFCDEVRNDGVFYPLGRWYQKWFYVHVEEITASCKTENDVVVEYIPLRCYYHRHTRGIFWEMEYIIPFANQLWFRYLLGWAMPPNIPLLKVFQTPQTKKMWKEQFMVQDMLVPVTSMAECLKDIDKNIAVYPMWLCPHLVRHHKEGGLVGEVSRAGEDEMYVDIGLYGVPQRQPYVHDTCMRRLEALVRKHRGYQGMYAVSYMNREEFDTMFHRKLYDECRVKYGAVDCFPDVFEKTCSKSK